MRKAARKAAQPSTAAAASKGGRDESGYHKGSCAMRLVATPDHRSLLEPGDFYWSTSTWEAGGAKHSCRVMWAMYPTGHVLCLPVLPVSDAIAQRFDRATWEWDGNEAAPTFTPSIHHVGCWHGYVREGRMLSV